MVQGVSQGSSQNITRRFGWRSEGSIGEVLICRHPGYFVVSGSFEISVPWSRVSQIWIIYTILPTIPHIGQDNYLALKPIRLGYRNRPEGGHKLHDTHLWTPSKRLITRSHSRVRRPPTAPYWRMVLRLIDQFGIIPLGVCLRPYRRL